MKTNTINITELEASILLGINYSEYGDTLGEAVWVFDAIDESLGKINSGVISSLSKKGLVITQGKGDDQTIALTELGIEICKENNLLGKYK